MRTRILFCLLIFQAITLSAQARDSAQDLQKTWTRRMAETEASLKAEDYQQARRLADKTVTEMVERLGPGEGSTSLLGTALTHKALAHAGLGEHDEAMWYWHTALGLCPKVAEGDLSSFGDAGRLLSENIELKPFSSSVSPTDGTINPPKLVKRRKPKFPHGAHYFGVTGALVVAVVVTADGKVHSPRIVTPLPAASLSYAALEAVKRWSFEPATLGATPVDVVFNLTVNYQGK